MSWELDNVKRDLERLKWDVGRKVEDEDFRRLKHEVESLEERVRQLETYIDERLSKVETRLEEIIGTQL